MVDKATIIKLLVIGVVILAAPVLYKLNKQAYERLLNTFPQLLVAIVLVCLVLAFFILYHTP
jgi:hypothetical protein